MGEMASKVNSYQDTNVSISPPSTPIVDTGMVRLGSDNPGAVNVYEASYLISVVNEYRHAPSNHSPECDRTFVTSPRASSILMDSGVDSQASSVIVSTNVTSASPCNVTMPGDELTNAYAMSAIATRLTVRHPAPMTFFRRLCAAVSSSFSFLHMTSFLTPLYGSSEVLIDG